VCYPPNRPGKRQCPSQLFENKIGSFKLGSFRKNALMGRRRGPSGVYPKIGFVSPNRQMYAITSISTFEFPGTPAAAMVVRTGGSSPNLPR